jgi:hypothetical protein
MSDGTVKYPHRLLGRECTLLPEATSRLGATRGDHARPQALGFAGDFLGRPNCGATNLPLLVAPPLIGKRGDQGRPGNDREQQLFSALLCEVRIGVMPPHRTLGKRRGQNGWRSVCWPQRH